MKVYKEKLGTPTPRAETIADIEAILSASTKDSVGDVEDAPNQSPTEAIRAFAELFGK